MIDKPRQFLPVDTATLGREALIQWVKEDRQSALLLVLGLLQPAALHMELLSQCDVMLRHALTTADYAAALNRLTKDT